MRGWWTDEADRQPYWESLGLDGEAPEDFSPAVAQTVYEALAAVRSAILLFQIQDLFDLDSDLRRQSAAADRVNVPGTVAESNWSYRWPVPVEELSSATELNRRVDLIIDARTAGE
jgi:4-alpha-glucanotransferase